MDIAKFMVGAIVLAAVATLIAFAATYWYVFVGLGILVYVIYVVVQKQKDERNKV